jgi:hypothetical protein
MIFVICLSWRKSDLPEYWIQMIESTLTSSANSASDEQCVLMFHLIFG